MHEIALLVARPEASDQLILLSHAVAPSAQDLCSPGRGSCPGIYA
jgi:hypothetical protein